MTKMSGRSWGEPCLSSASMTVRWRWECSAAQIFLLLRIFFCLIWDFWLKSANQFRVNVFPTKTPEKDTNCSPKMWINTKTSLCVHSIILISACCFHARICWALWAVSCTWGMSSLLLMSRGMLRSLQRIRLNTWPGWVSPVREISQEKWIVEDFLLWAWYHHIFLDWFRSCHKFHFYLA